MGKKKKQAEKLYSVTANEIGLWEIIPSLEGQGYDDFNRPIEEWIDYFRMEIDEKTYLLARAQEILSNDLAE